MRLVPAARTFLALASTAALLHADGSGVAKNFITGPDLPLQPFHRILAADIDGNVTNEVVVLRGSELIVYPDPDINDSYVVVANNVIDVDVVRLPSGGSLLAFTSPAGLNTVAVENSSYVVRFVDGAPLWMGATRVRGTKVGGLIGVAADSRTFFAGSLDPFNQPATQLFTIGPVVRDVKLIDWDTVSGQELAILTSNGLQLRKSSGAFVFARAAVVPGDAIAVVSQQNSTQGLAWVMRVLDGTATLMLFHASLGSAYQGPVGLGVETYASACAADIDVDGDDDLVLARMNSGSISIVENKSAPDTWNQPLGGGAFEAGITDTIELGPDEDSSSGLVLCDNFFNQHLGSAVIPGFALASSAPGGLSVRAQSEEIPSGVLASPDFARIDFTSAYVRGGLCPEVAPGSTDSHSLWSVLFSNGWGTTTATHVEVIVRESAFPGLAPLQNALHHLMVPIDAGGISSTSVSFTGRELPSDGEESSPRCYYVGARPVRLNAAGTNILEAWRWSVMGVSSVCQSLYDMNNYSISLHQEVPYDNLLVCGDYEAYLHCGQPQYWPFGARYIASGVPLTRFPTSGPGQMPVVYPWNY